MNYLWILIALVPYVGLGQDWNLKRNKNGVKVYFRQQDSLKTKEFKALTHIKAEFKDVLQVLLDGNSLWKWNHCSTSSKTLRQLSDSEFSFWIKNDLPWPLKDREVVSRVKVHKISRAKVKISITPEPDSLISLSPKSLSIRNFSGYWLLEKENGYTKITHQLFAESRYPVPSWLLGSFTTNIPYHTLLNLREFVEQKAAAQIIK